VLFLLSLNTLRIPIFFAQDKHLYIQHLRITKRTYLFRFYSLFSRVYSLFFFEFFYFKIFFPTFYYICFIYNWIRTTILTKMICSIFRTNTEIWKQLLWRIWTQKWLMYAYYLPFMISLMRILVCFVCMLFLRGDMKVCLILKLVCLKDGKYFYIYFGSIVFCFCLFNWWKGFLFLCGL
jgi:hypothetical protein